MSTVISYTSPELVKELLKRSLNVDSSIRNCHDQYWYTQSGLLRPDGLAVLDILAKAGFNDKCLKNGSSFQKGIVCGVTMGVALPSYKVSSAVSAVEFLSEHDFDVNATCFGKTIMNSIENEQNQIIKQ